MSAVVSAAVGATFAALRAELEAALTGAGTDPVERLRALCPSYLAVAAQQPGRYRVFGGLRQAPPGVGGDVFMLRVGVLEALTSLAPERRTAPNDVLEPLHLARSCYDRVAGRVGVALADVLQAKGWLEASETNDDVTAEVETGLAAFGVDLPALRKQRRHFGRPCLDWTERRPHIAGASGAALMARLLERQWLKKDPGARVLHLTRAGQAGLERVLGLSVRVDPVKPSS